ncbi:hypothetical protein Tco_1475542 [Tanacetum coccineum]
MGRGGGSSNFSPGAVLRRGGESNTCRSSVLEIVAFAGFPPGKMVPFSWENTNPLAHWSVPEACLGDLFYGSVLSVCPTDGAID